MYDLNTYALEQNRLNRAEAENSTVSAGLSREGLPQAEARRMIDEVRRRTLRIAIPQPMFLRDLGSRMRARIWHAAPSAGLR